MGKTEVTAEQTRHPRTPLGDIVEAGAGPTLILGDTLAGEWQCERCHKTPKSWLLQQTLCKEKTSRCSRWFYEGVIYKYWENSGELWHSEPDDRFYREMHCSFIFLSPPQVLFEF